MAVKTATNEPNEILPCIYCVTTIIAPPQPGIAPKKAAIGTWYFCVFERKDLMSYFVRA